MLRTTPLILLLLIAAGCTHIDSNAPEGQMGDLLAKQLHAQFDGKPLSDREQYEIGELQKVEPQDKDFIFHYDVKNPRAEKYSYTWMIKATFDGTTWKLLDGDGTALNSKSGDTQKLHLQGNATHAAVWDRIVLAFNAAHDQYKIANKIR